MKFKTFLPLLILAFVLFFAQTRDFRLMFDGLTYSTLAKNIVTTGDWKVLHYNAEVMPDFYMHPPLAIWMQAAVFKVLGASESIARILPATLAFFSVVLTCAIGTLIWGTWAGWLSGLVLITSTRFIKWGTNFYLDGPLAFWLVAATFCWTWLIKKKTHQGLAAFGFVFCALAAFWTKGVVAAVLPVALLGSLVVDQFFKRRNAREKPFWKSFELKPISLGALAGLLPFLGWIIFGGGCAYLATYFQVSVASRVGEVPLEYRLAPFLNLLKTYWPWLPFYLGGLFLLLRTRTGFFVAAMSLGIPVGFFVMGGYLEHYSVPFFPFAALIAGSHLSVLTQKYQIQIEKKFSTLVVVIVILIATLAPNVHVQKETPPSLTLDRLKRLDLKFGEFIFTDATIERWYGIAYFSWNLSVPVKPVAEIPSEPREGQLLLATTSQKTLPGWQEIPCFGVPGFKLLGAIPKRGTSAAHTPRSWLSACEK